MIPAAPEKWKHRFRAASVLIDGAGNIELCSMGTVVKFPAGSLAEARELARKFGYVKQEPKS